jgi:uncharacterized protein YegL
MSSLDKRDYTLIIDKSGSMGTTDMPGGRSRWDAMQEATVAVARRCEQFDPDGITVYLFASRFKRYDNVTSAKVAQIFRENEPMGSTALDAVLQNAFDNFFQRKASGQLKPNGDLWVVVTDGEPNDQRAVMKVIIEATRKMTRDEELGLSFIQIGKDPLATRFLKVLDDELVRAGAKFDICDTVTMDDMEDVPLNEILLGAIDD